MAVTKKRKKRVEKVSKNELKTHVLTTIPESIKKGIKEVEQGKTKRVPTKKDPVTGETTLNFEYMLKTDTEKYYSKAKKLVKTSLKKYPILITLKILILFQALCWNVEYYVTSFFDKIASIKRYLSKWLPQRLSRGFDDRELWNLDMTLIEFISKWLHPRIKGFREMKRYGYPATFKSQKDWEKVLQQIDEGLQIIVEEGDTVCFISDPVKKKKAEKALRLFSEHWPKLWD